MKEKEIYRIAQEIYSHNPDWVTFHREILGMEGVARRAFPTDARMSEFKQSQEYAEIQQMLARLRERSPHTPAADNPLEPTRIITVRLPDSLHESLRKEAHDRRTSMNKLCIAKLLLKLDEDLIPPLEAHQQGDSGPLQLYFDLRDYSPSDVGEFISILSELYRDVGGDRLVIEDMEILENSMVHAS